MEANTTLKIFEESEKEIWNDFIDNARWGDVLQFWQWGEAKRSEGWEPIRMGVMQDGVLILAAQILIKPAKVLGNYLYIPHGPVFQAITGLKSGIKTLKQGMLQLAKEKEGFVIEIEPKTGFIPDELFSTPIISKNLQFLIDPAVLKIFESNGWFETGRNMQPVYKLFYDLDDSPEQLLALMKKNTRYNVKLADKKGVLITEYSFSNPEIHSKIDTYYEMLLEMQERAKGYPIRAREYFHKLVNDFAETGRMSLFESSLNGEVISMNISQRTKFWSSSFYASSNRLFPEVKAPYLMRWESILKAREFGSKLYDFWGIVPNSDQHKGYSDNKMSFGGIRINTHGILALPLSPSRYFIWDKMLPLRSKILGLIRR